MEEYFIEHDTLAKLIDALISQKYPDKAKESLDEIREKSIRALDDRIATKIFSSLSEEQLKEISALLDSQEKSPVTFQEFFQKHSINLNQKITEAVEEFSREFLGGKDV